MQTLKTAYVDHLKRNIKFGRRRPRVVHPHLRLANYLDLKKLPAPPGSADYSPKALPALTNVYENNALGDCVIAGGYHVVGTETGNADGGTPFVATDEQIITDYSAIGGYVPGDPSTDNGCDMQTAMAYWMQHGFADGTKLLGYLAVDPTNVPEMQAALFLFENLYMGLELPDAYISPFPSANGFTWGPGTPDPQNGHCIMACGYDSNGLKIDTWGLLGSFLYSAAGSLLSSSVGGELYVLITPDQLAKGQTTAPNGVAWADLISDWNAMGGNIPAPAPAPAPSPAPTPAPPAPTPAPTPSGGPSFAQARQAISEIFAKGHPFLQRAKASELAINAIQPLWPSSKPQARPGKR